MTKEFIEEFRRIIIPYMVNRFEEINYEGQGGSDAEEFKSNFNEICDMAIKALEQEPILDKIRAEIANHCGVNTDYCDSCRFCTDSIEVREILKIIDKYKAETEAE